MNTPLQKNLTKAVLGSASFTAIFGTIAGFVVGALGAARAAGIQDSSLVFSWMTRSHALFMLLPVIFVGLLLSVIVWAAVRSTHKVAGPMIPIGRALERVAAGDYSTTVRLRQDDWLHDLADQMNESFQAVERRNQAMERRIAELTTELKNQEQADSQVEGIPESVTADA
jgi:nitrogen fixation/metabolism regulation signal transduction histidine kinase